MVAYLKASTKEKMYSDYLQAAKEAEKEEAMEPLHSQMADNPTKPKVTNIFPLQKLKCTQPVKTPAVQVVHFEQDCTEKEESAKSDKPDGIKGMTGVYSAPSQDSEGSSTEWETLLPLQQPRIFYLWMPVGEDIQNSYPFKLKGGGWRQRREPRPLKSR